MDKVQKEQQSLKQKVGLKGKCQVEHMVRQLKMYRRYQNVCIHSIWQFQFNCILKNKL